MAWHVRRRVLASATRTQRFEEEGSEKQIVKTVLRAVMPSLGMERVLPMPVGGNPTPLRLLQDTTVPGIEWAQSLPGQETWMPAPAGDPDGPHKVATGSRKARKLVMDSR